MSALIKATVVTMTALTSLYGSIDSDSIDELVISSKSAFHQYSTNEYSLHSKSSISLNEKFICYESTKLTLTEVGFTNNYQNLVISCLKTGSFYITWTIMGNYFRSFDY
jgi:hypothetical protein